MQRAVGKGSGFVIETSRARPVVTAAHCLPKLPPSATISYAAERTYERLLGKVGKRRRICAECLFVDSVADIAVLASPEQNLSKLADAYDRLAHTNILVASRLNKNP